MLVWELICEDFAGAFNAIFSSDRKAHFDNLTEDLRIIDGVKFQWCNLLLLDGIVYILKNDGFNHSIRRAFNQPLILYQCIMRELRRVHEVSHETIVEWKRRDLLIGGEKQSRKNLDCEIPQLHITISDPNWQSMSKLESYLFSIIPASKAKHKFAAITELLTSHDCFSKFDFDLPIILHNVMLKVLYMFNPAKPRQAVVIKKPYFAVKKRKTSEAVAAEEDPNPPSQQINTSVFTPSDNFYFGYQLDGPMIKGHKNTFSTTQTSATEESIGFEAGRNSSSDTANKKKRRCGAYMAPAKMPILPSITSNSSSSGSITYSSSTSSLELQLFDNFTPVCAFYPAIAITTTDTTITASEATTTSSESTTYASGSTGTTTPTSTESEVVSPRTRNRIPGGSTAAAAAAPPVEQDSAHGLNWDDAEYDRLLNCIDADHDDDDSEAMTDERCLSSSSNSVDDEGGERRSGLGCRPCKNSFVNLGIFEYTFVAGSNNGVIVGNTGGCVAAGHAARVAGNGTTDKVCAKTMGDEAETPSEDALYDWLYPFVADDEEQQHVTENATATAAPTATSSG